MPTIKQLKQRHPSIDVDEVERLRALYEGGKRFRDMLTEFLPPRPQEPKQRYVARKKESVYRNYIGPIIDYFTALLFSSSPRALAKDETGETLEDSGDFYRRFTSDCNRLGTNVDTLFKEILTDALVSGKSWVWLQHPEDVGARNLAEFEELGIGDSWLTSLTQDEVLDWETDESGNLAWAVVYFKTRKRGGLADGRDTVVETWHHLLPDRVDTYRHEYNDKKKPNEDCIEANLVSSTKHRYGAVPLVCLELPVGLWVASRLETPQLAHFRLSNAQTWGMSATCYAMPVFAVKDPKAFRHNMGAGYGFFIQPPDESITWTAPDAAPFAALSDEIKSHKDEIFRIAHTMALGVENNAAAIGRSAESKATDARATAVVMLSYARVVKETIEVVFDMVSRARGEKITWSIEGMDDFAASDVFGIIEALAELEPAGGIPSKTFQVEAKSRIADSLMPDLDQATKNAIRKEISEGVEEQTVDAQQEREEKRMKAISGALAKEKPKVNEVTEQQAS